MLKQISREYSTEWTKYAQYNQCLRQHIRSKNNQNLLTPIQDIQSFVGKMTNLKSSAIQLVEQFAQNWSKMIPNSSNHSAKSIASFKPPRNSHKYKARKPGKGVFPAKSTHLSPITNTNTFHSNLLPTSKDNYSEFDGCALSDIEIHSNDEMKDSEDFHDDRKQTMLVQGEKTAKYYHDNYYGQGGIYPITHIPFPIFCAVVMCYE